eukprot:7380104-Prymnesium_polylepis.1
MDWDTAELQDRAGRQVKCKLAELATETKLSGAGTSGGNGGGAGGTAWHVDLHRAPSSTSGAGYVNGMGQPADTAKADTSAMEMPHTASHPPG